MKVDILKKAQKDIPKLDINTIKNILLIIKDLENYPDVSNIKKLTKHKPIYRKRIGNYRVLFDIENDLQLVEFCIETKLISDLEVCLKIIKL